MTKPNKYFDVVLLTIFGFFIIISFCKHFTVGLVVYVNNLLALIALGFGVYLKFRKSKRERYVVFVLILLATGGIINFVGGWARVGRMEENRDIHLQYPGIDPIMFIVLIVYCIINWNFVIDTYVLFKRGSDEDQTADFEKMKNFYYDKFKSYTIDEFERLHANFNTYPPEAQAAFTKIIEERTSTEID